MNEICPLPQNHRDRLPFQQIPASPGVRASAVLLHTLYPEMQRFHSLIYPIQPESLWAALFYMFSFNASSLSPAYNTS